ncbi:hypothetical protein [Streptomyces sp. ST1015]|uniref:hypothetical protein n=1 Tax=unclassified Streptomyces TaxID=2593676 RepID=UPI000DD91BCE|nr:hypothetical protein [Streptomyces sp. ST1015]QZZ28269.1 hypothetical protein A7X85_20125 [Streptomyces sp. ST1015]
MRHRLTPHLVPYLLRLAPRLPLALCAGAALAVAALPPALSLRLEPGIAALLLRMTAVLCALPVAFALDDPGARITATLPYPVVLRRLLRLVPVCAAVAVTWAVCAVLLRGAAYPDGLPLAGFFLETAVLVSGAVLLAALGLRVTGGERGSAFAAPGSVLLLLVLALSPARPQLFAPPYGEAWDASRRVWASALVVLVALSGVLLREGRGSRGR